MTAGSSVPEAARAARAATDLAKAQQPCEEHWWISTHQPDFPVYWIVRCGLCGTYSAEQMQEQITAVVAAAVAEERATTGRRIEAALALCDEADETVGSYHRRPHTTRLRAALVSPGEGE